MSSHIQCDIFFYLITREEIEDSSRGMVDRAKSESYIVLSSLQQQNEEDQINQDCSRETSSPVAIQTSRNSSPLHENGQSSDSEVPAENMHFRHEASMVHDEHETTTNHSRYGI